MPEDERRRYPRATAIGSAVVHASGQYLGAYVLENLSASGALLVGDVNLAAGAPVRLLVQLHRPAGRLVLDATIVRSTSRGAQRGFAVHFASVPPEALEVIHAAVVHEATHRAGQGMVVLFDAGPNDADGLQHALDEIGYETVIVHTPLDAIAWLHAPAAGVRALVACTVLPGIDGLSFFEFIATDCPTVRRVLACDGPLTRVHHEALRLKRIDAMVQAPWTHSTLRLALAG